MANYQILVKCILDKADLQAQLDKVQQTVNSVTGKGGKGGGLVLINSGANSAAIEEVRNKFQSLRNDIASIDDIKVTGPANAEGIVKEYTSALVTYKNTLGEVTQAQMSFLKPDASKGVAGGWYINQETLDANYAKQRDSLQKLGRLQEAAQAEDLKRTQDAGKMQDAAYAEDAQRTQNLGKMQSAAHEENARRTQDLGKMQEAAKEEDLRRLQSLGKMQEAAYAEDAKREKAKRDQLQSSGKMQEAAKTEDLKRTQDLGKMQEAALAEDANRERAKQAAVQKLGQMQDAASAEDKQRNQQRLDALHALANEENKAFDNRNKLTAQYGEKLKVMEAQHKAAFANPEVQKNLSAFQAQLAKFDGSKKSTLELQQAFGKLNTSIVQYDQSQINVNRNGQNLIQQLSLAAKKVVEWGIVTGIVYGALREMRMGIQYVRDLNKELTNIQIVTGMTANDAGNLAVQFNKLATEMGATTLEVTKGSLEWFRQGKTIQETSELMRSTMMLSKLGNMESAQATEYLTSTLNGFKLEAEDAVGVVDKLIVLDNQFATSSAEIAEGLSRSANSAQQAGITFDELASYITVVSAVTRKSAIDKFGALWYNS